MTDALSRDEILHLMSLREVFAGFAHEIAQPLNAIMIAAQVVQLRVSRSNLSDEEKEFLVQRLGIVSSQIVRASHIVEELRGISKGDGGQTPQTDIRRLFDKAQALMGQQLLVRGIELVVESHDALPLMKTDQRVAKLALVQGLAFARDSVQALWDRHQEKTAPFKKVLNVQLAPADNGSVINIAWNFGEILDTTPVLDPGSHLGLLAAGQVLSALGGRLETTNSCVGIFLP
jgi:C4-dicarboxylate-specific signal transduction histidine kinase